MGSEPSLQAPPSRENKTGTNYDRSVCKFKYKIKFMVVKS